MTKSEYMKDWYQKNIEKQKIYNTSPERRIAKKKWTLGAGIRANRHTHLKRKYGISLEQYEDMNVKQNGLCFICEKPETTKDWRYGTIRLLAVDHCHKKNIVRKLLCRNCNTSMGLLQEDLNILQNMINYIKEYS